MENASLKKEIASLKKENATLIAKACVCSSAPQLQRSANYDLMSQPLEERPSNH